VTDLDVYQPAAIEAYQPRMVMTPEAAQALDEKLTQCIRAVLHEGTDYGLIPGTNEKSLWRPGAQKMLLWFGLSFTCDRIYEIDTDDDGHRLGVTYRATIFRRFPDGSKDVAATCEGYAGYDESKFYKSAEEVRRDAEAKERYWAKKDGRVANPTKWQNLGEYKAPWNAVIKRAQKRAIRFNQDREEDDHAPAPQDDGPIWYEQAIGHALSFTDIDAGRTLYVEAAQAHRDGLCTRRQQDHVQNTVRQRVKLLEKATPVDVEDLGRQAAQHASPGEGEDSAPAVPDETAPSGPAAGAAPAELLEDEPGTVSKAQLTKLHTVLTGLGFGGEDREQKLKVTEAITGRTLGSSLIERSSKNLSWTEARKVIDTLDGMDRDQLIAYMAGQEGGTDG